MNMWAGDKLLLFAAVFIVTSCVTINIYFPAAAVEKAADRIVDEVWGDESIKPGQDGNREEGQPQGALETAYIYALAVISPRGAEAAEADIDITTPAIRALRKSIQDRSDSIKPYLDSNNVGITNDGFLTVITGEGLNLKQKAQLTRLIDAENKDRNDLYVEITRANNFAPDKVEDVKKIFADSWIKKAKSGWWVQGPEGDWKKK
ncbi:MAG: YdbL family protein [Nitrospiraceae bacterium]|nr:MAG: YdbL family protein [Nitrospiraceae bacterium]